MTANSSAVFEMLCPALKQVVIQGSVQCPEMLAVGDLVVGAPNKKRGKNKKWQ